jgi:hypothetical protein
MLYVRIALRNITPIITFKKVHRQGRRKNKKVGRAAPVFEGHFWRRGGGGGGGGGGEEQ